MVNMSFATLKPVDLKKKKKMEKLSKMQLVLTSKGHYWPFFKMVDLSLLDINNGN